jgi:hypothetical protein
VAAEVKRQSTYCMFWLAGKEVEQLRDQTQELRKRWTQRKSARPQTNSTPIPGLAVVSLSVTFLFGLFVNLSPSEGP